MTSDEALRFLVTPGATQWQYLNGVRNAEAISPDNWHVTQRLLDTGHFALEEDGDVISRIMRDFLKKNLSQKSR